MWQTSGLPPTKEDFLLSYSSAVLEVNQLTCAGGRTEPGAGYTLTLLPKSLKACQERSIQLILCE